MEYYLEIKINSVISLFYLAFKKPGESVQKILLSPRFQKRDFFLFLLKYCLFKLNAKEKLNVS